MAERLGVPTETVKDARSRLDLKEAQAEALLKKLEEDQATLRAAEEDLAGRRLEIESAEARVALAEGEITARKKTEVETCARELRRRGEGSEGDESPGDGARWAWWAGGPWGRGQPLQCLGWPRRG